MKKIQTLALKMGGSIAALALVLGVSSVQANSVFWFHQPKVPPSMERFKKK